MTLEIILNKIPIQHLSYIGYGGRHIAFGLILAKFLNQESIIIKILQSRFGCGIKKISKPSSLSINGVQTYHGEHPWLASLQVKHLGVFKNICGASLINRLSLLTGNQLNSFKII